MLCDHPQGRSPRSQPLPFVPTPGPEWREPLVTGVRLAHRLELARVTLADFGFARPDVRLAASASAPGEESFYEDYRYAPSTFVKGRAGAPRWPDDAERGLRAEVGLEARRRLRRIVELDSNVLSLAPGTVVAIEGHPRADLGPERPLLVTDCHVRGKRAADCPLSAVAAFASEPWRPAQRTPKPVMRGPQSATVVGPAGEPVHTDEHGRIRVQFHWDRDGKHDGDSSCWVRVSQICAGAGWGGVALPRPGHEVVVDFFEGDPDQPIVVGRAHDGKNATPRKLPDEKTASAWITRSTAGEGGHNEIRLDDRAGSELFAIRAERDQHKRSSTTSTSAPAASTVYVHATRTTVVAGTDTALCGGTVHRYHTRDADGGAPITAGSTAVEMTRERVARTGSATVPCQPDIDLSADGDIVIQAGGDVIIDGGPRAHQRCAADTLSSPTRGAGSAGPLDGVPNANRKVRRHRAQAARCARRAQGADRSAPRAGGTYCRPRHGARLLEDLATRSAESTGDEPRQG